MLLDVHDLVVGPYFFLDAISEGIATDVLDKNKLNFFNDLNKT